MLIMRGHPHTPHTRGVPRSVASSHLLITTSALQNAVITPGPIQQLSAGLWFHFMVTLANFEFCIIAAPSPHATLVLPRAIVIALSPEASPLLCRIDFQPQRCNPGLCVCIFKGGEGGSRVINKTGTHTQHNS